MQQFDLFGAKASLPKRRRARVPPPTPYTGWVPPKEYPRLNEARVISLDTETFDPGIAGKHGPGWATHNGCVVGVSVSVDADHKWYFPIRHDVGRQDNMDPVKTLRWLNDTLSTDTPKVGANLIYDVGWLMAEGVTVGGDLYDVQFAEALLSEDKKVGLDDLAKRYLKEHKASDTLYQWCAETYGGSSGPSQRANIYRAPPVIVGPYAEADADLPLRILPKQIKKLQKQGLYKLFLQECRLIRLLIAMRFKGVRIDLDRAEDLHKKLEAEIARQQTALNNSVGVPVDIYAASSLARAFDRVGLPYGYTAKSKQPSFTTDFMKTIDHDLPRSIMAIKELDRLAKVFIRSYILENNKDGRIHCEFHPLRGDAYGTRSGRLSSSNPNLQNIPSRTALGKIIRTLFVPDIGHAGWCKQDASQIEYRFLAHFARGEGAKGIQSAYRKNPKTDYHRFTQDLIRDITQLELDRAKTKSVNFGFIYGMGKAATAKQLGLDNAGANSLFEAYHTAIPFAKATMNYYMKEAQDKGFVKTITGRRSRFNLYEPTNFRDYEERQQSLPLRQAIRVYGSRVQRSQTHKALNRVLQGSAADFLKYGMLACMDAGLFDEVGVPLLTVHDELNFSDPGGKDHCFKEIIHTCENAIKTKVPLIIDEEKGPSWGKVK